MRRTASIFLCLLAFVPALLAQPKEELIYPRGSAAAGAPASHSPDTSNSGIILAVALLAGAAGWWLWQKRRGPARSGVDAARLAILESRSLGSRQYLVVADYDGRKFLLGVCPGSIEMLTPLDAEKTKET
ncbi:MAG TPA: flagellar biosynthetic protein FliO [Lacunisphaera sp.]|nr:flagellar biosynthetic protein FliO [Lacunisphaera sp.]